MMKYVLRLQSRVEESSSVSEKHAKLTSALIAVEGQWGIKSAAHPPPDFGTEMTAHFHLTKLFRKNGVRGFVNYRFRRGLRDDAGCDDFIALEFNPARVDFGSLITSALPQYIRAFEPYFGYVADEEFTFLDFDRSRNVNRRADILRIFPICFLDREICSRALGLTPNEVASRASGIAERVELIANGVFVVFRSEPLAFDVAKEASDVLTAAVKEEAKRGRQKGSCLDS